MTKNKVHTPQWTALAVAEHLKSVWHDGMGKTEAWDSASEAFRDVLGWGASGKRGLKKHGGFRTAASCWETAVVRFQLSDRKTREKLRSMVLLPYCRREGIVLEEGESSMLCFQRLQAWDGEQLTVRPLRQVIHEVH